jgi:DNA polymerase III delta prime subunit
VDDEESSEFSERRNLLREERRMMEVKIRIKRKQLEELLSNKKLSGEKVLEEMMMRKVFHGQIGEGQWKPRLQSIPEVQDEDER